VLVILLLRQVQHAAVPAVLLLQYFFDKYNTLKCRCVTVILLLRQVQQAVVLAVLLLHYYYDNYNTLPCLRC